MRLILWHVDYLASQLIESSVIQSFSQSARHSVVQLNNYFVKVKILNHTVLSNLNLFEK